MHESLLTANNGSTLCTISKGLNSNVENVRGSGRHSHRRRSHRTIVAIESIGNCLEEQRKCISFDMQLLLLTWCFRLSTKHRVGWLVLLFERGTYLNLQNLCSDVCIWDSESSCHLNYELRSIKTNQNDWIPCFSLLASFKLDLNFTSCAFFRFNCCAANKTATKTSNMGTRHVNRKHGIFQIDFEYRMM